MIDFEEFDSYRDELIKALYAHSDRVVAGSQERVEDRKTIIRALVFILKNLPEPKESE